MRSLVAAGLNPPVKPVMISMPLPNVTVPLMAAPGTKPIEDAVAATESPALKMIVSTAAEFSVPTKSAPMPASI